MRLCALLAQRTTTAVSKRTAPSTVDRRLTLPVATVLPELIRRSSTANIMADVATTPRSATSFLDELCTALWGIAPVEAVDGVAEAAAPLVIVVVDTAAGAGTDAAGDAAGDVAVAKDTHPHMPPTCHMFPPITTP